MNTKITNINDIIDSRDVIERIKYLESTDDEDEQRELELLQSLADEVETFNAWDYGAILINDDYFEEYAKQFAEDIGAINSDESWPCAHIDWASAADALKMDYSAVDFDGQTYWIHK